MATVTGYALAAAVVLAGLAAPTPKTADQRF